MAFRRLAKFNRRAPVSATPPFLIFNPHSDKDVPFANLNGDIYTASIDPGIVKCGVSVFRRSPGQPPYAEFIMRINFTTDDDIFAKPEEKSDKGIETSYYTNVFSVLDKYLSWFEMCQYIVIESQPPLSYEVGRMSQHLITYLMMSVKNKGNRPLIVEFDSHLKTRVLGAPTKMDKPQRKEWARVYAINLLKQRGDTRSYEYLEKLAKGKAFDMTDTVCQEEAWWQYFNSRLAPPKPVLQTQATPGKPVLVFDDVIPEIQKPKLVIV